MRKKLKYLLLLLLLVGVSVVSAMLISTLSIEGVGTIGKNSWVVYFDNITEKDSNVEGEVNLVNNNGISFSTNLVKPGDYYEFTVDVINNGSIDAMVDKFILSEVPDVIKYTVSYEDGMEISKKDRLASKDKDTILVRIEYKSDLQSSDLNNEDLIMNFSFELDYIQDDGSGIERLPSLVGNLVKDVKDSSTLVYNKAVTADESGVYKLNNINFFRGGVINNNVVIDDTCYYALRTTEEGNLRLLYNGKYVDGTCKGENVFIDNIAFNDEASNVAYEDSIIRTTLNNWYQDNMTKYDNAIVAGYCNDLSMKGEKYYNYVKFEQGIVDLECNNILEDKVGLLSVDEILMSGYGRYGANRAYIDANAAYYSMSTYSNNKVVIVNEYGAKNISSVTSELGVRPVITIKSNTGILDGEGTKENPYIASLKV